MATYKQILCPKCQKKLCSVMISSENTNRTFSTCTKCGIKYCIEYGNNKSKISKS